MGFEVVATFASTMKNPSRYSQRRFIAGGVAIAAILHHCGIGIGAAVPTEQLSLDSGIWTRLPPWWGAQPPADDDCGHGLFGDAVRQHDLLGFGVNNVASYARAMATCRVPLRWCPEDRHAQRLGTH